MVVTLVVLVVPVYSVLEWFSNTPLQQSLLYIYTLVTQVAMEAVDLVTVKALEALTSGQPMLVELVDTQVVKDLRVVELVVEQHQFFQLGINLE